MSVFAGYYDASYPPALWQQPQAPVGAAARSAAASAPAATLVVAAGAPGSYSPEQKAADRPRNIGELRERATPADPQPWAPGEYVLVGERGKRAHWDGTDWRQDEAPTVPTGTVERSAPAHPPRSDA